MKKQKKRSFLILCSVLLLSACGKNNMSGKLGSEIWETMPEVTFGVLESEKLSVAKWSSGRAEETSRYGLCEGENGYYYVNEYGCLYYADKKDLTNWVVLCMKPDCDHQPGNLQCSAYIGSNSVLAKEGRLYFSEAISRYPHLADLKGNGNAIFSMAPNGSDLRLEYSIKDALISDIGSMSNYLTSRYWIYFSNELDKTGVSRIKLFRVDGNGTKQLWDETRNDGQEALYLVAQSGLLGMNGEEIFYCNAIETPGYFSFLQEEPVRIELPDFPTLGAYLAGDTLRFFRQNDGYYDYSMETGEEVFLAPARLENSYASIMLPNLVIESTLSSLRGRVSGMEHSMALFDGQQWHSIQLPDDLRFAQKNVILTPRCVTSDAVWFSYTEKVIEIDEEEDKVYEYYDANLYRIRLDTDDWTLEHFATVQQPRVSKK